MRMMMAAAAWLAISPVTAAAGEHVNYSPIYSTKEALNLCRTISPDYCDGILQGVAEASWGEMSRLKCPPVLYGPGARISDNLSEFVKVHPEFIDKPAYLAVRALALQACPKKPLGRALE